MTTILSLTEIEERAKQRGISRTKLCEEAGISPSTYTRWKNGSATPLVKTYRRLLAVISVPTTPTNRRAS